MKVRMKVRAGRDLGGNGVVPDGDRRPRHWVDDAVWRLPTCPQAATPTMTYSGRL